MTTLYVRDESGFREAEAADVLDRAQALLAQRYRVGSPVLSSPAITREFLRIHLGACEHEVFGVLHLDLCGALSYVQDHFHRALRLGIPLFLLHITESSTRGRRSALELSAWGRVSQVVIAQQHVGKT